MKGIESPRAFPYLVTDSSREDGHFVREAAIALYARDALVGHDSDSAENALAHSRAIFDLYETAEHDGDCTQVPGPCIRCLVDEAKRETQEIHDN
jgi:hypothetical protein